MKTVLKRELFTTTVFDSGALGLMTTVIHQFSEPGQYSANIFKDGKPYSVIRFAVSEKTETMQININLAEKAERSKREKDCDCSDDNRKFVQTVSPKGYVVFHATAGGGWSVRVGDESEPVFDSTRLASGDMFALTLLEPTQYSVVNRHNKAKMTIEVDYTKKDRDRLNRMDAVAVKAGEKFDPERVKLTSTQGLLFQIETDARIVITKTGGKEKRDKRSPLRFRRLKSPHAQTKKSTPEKGSGKTKGKGKAGKS